MVNHANAVFRGSNPRRRDGRKHANRQRTGLRGKFTAIEFFARALDAREGAPENRQLSPAAELASLEDFEIETVVSANILATQGPRSPVT